MSTISRYRRTKEEQRNDEHKQKGIFQNISLRRAALAVSGACGQVSRAEAAIDGQITGVCLYVPTLGNATDFVELMNKNARGDWTVHPLTGTLMDNYFKTRSLYEDAKGKANTFVGVVDPATFAIVHEAIVDSSGSFHYITYEDRNRVIFSAQL